MTKNLSNWCLSLLVFFGSFYGEAKEIANLFESPRSFGRGKTYVAAYDTNEASRLNPASIAETDITFQLRFLDFDLFYAEKGIGKLSTLQSATTNSFLSEAKGLFKGTNLNARGQFSLFSLRIGSFEFSPFFVAKGFADLRNPSLPDIEYSADATLGANLVYAFSIGKNLSIGVTLRPLSRSYIAGRAGVSELLDTENLEDLATVKNGTGLGLDVGVIYALANNFRLGATVQNVGDTEYFQDYGSEPPAIKQTINLGALLRVDLLGGHLDFLMDGQGILNRNGVNLLRLLHLGVEQGWSLFTRDHDFGVLFGVNEGYFGGGFFADAYFVRLDFSAYGVELGQYPGQRPDRRMAFTLSSAVTF